MADHSRSGPFLLFIGIGICASLGLGLLTARLHNQQLQAQLEMSGNECIRTDPFSVSAGMPNAAHPPGQRPPLATGFPLRHSDS